MSHEDAPNLVTTSALVVANAALALNVAVRQEGRVGRAISLGGLALLNEAVLPEARENVLDDCCVLLRGSAPEDIEVDPEPVVDVLVNGVILGTQCGRINPLGQCLGLCRSAVLI